jgi:hypothetical protein
VAGSDALGEAAGSVVLPNIRSYDVVAASFETT